MNISLFADVNKRTKPQGIGRAEKTNPMPAEGHETPLALRGSCAIFGCQRTGGQRFEHLAVKRDWHEDEQEPPEEQAPRTV